MNGQVKMIVRKCQLTNVLIRKLTHFGPTFQSLLETGLCDISKRAQSRTEMIDLIEVQNAKSPGNRKESSNAPKKHPDPFRHLASDAGMPFALIKGSAFLRG